MPFHTPIASASGWKHVNFPEGSGWPTWQRAYRYGLLVIEPPQELASILDPIRQRLDPVSAGQFGAHITVTPPFAAAPSSADEERIRTAVRSAVSIRLQLDRPTQFSRSSVVYLPVVPSQGLYELRTVLLATGLFRLDLPHTSDFVPHLTLSEFGTAPEEGLKGGPPAGNGLPPRNGRLRGSRRGVSFLGAPYLPPELGPAHVRGGIRRGAGSNGRSNW